MVERAFGVRDLWPVVTEPFSQWVIEDAFCHGRPPLDEVGVQFVSDVRPYALMKTRLLNASHSALGYLGSLAGHHRTDAAVGDPVFAAYIERLMAEEVAPLLPPVPGIDLDAYQGSVLERLGNPAIADRLSRLCRNGSTKVPGHVLSSIREARARRRPHALLTLAVAGWCRYLRGTDENGRSLVLDDPLADHMRELALIGGDDPRPLLAERSIFGDLGADRGFSDAVARDLRDLGGGCVRSVVAERVARDELLAPA
jgi:fructuronate reductase/mannitol 2-dehydrogenase